MSHDDDTGADELDALVLAYDRALVEGSMLSQDAAGPHDLDDAGIKELRRRQRCLQRLEMLWPRLPLTGESLQCRTEALALVDQLRQLPDEDAQRLRMITTPDQLKQAVVESGLILKADLEASLEDLGPNEPPRTLNQLAYELVQRNILSRQQLLLLCRGEIRKLLLDDYLIVEEIGRGGMGVVYRALDRKRNIHVALKTLPKASAAAIHRFKQEFRSLADLVHPNLVVLDELRCADGQWFFTMELVQGRHLTQYVRGEHGAVEGSRSSTNGVQPGKKGSQFAAASRCPLTTSLQFERLRRSFQQLAEGLHVLHRSGKLHRDIKPSNVLVTEEGRVVLVDFGLASDLPALRAEQPDGQPVVGTVAYMSPEQSTGESLDEASDWYSVGVMLYEILFGQRPFEGSLEQILDQKCMGPQLPRRETVPAEHADLADLCGELLQPQLERRPRGAEILQRLLGAGGVQARPGSETSTPESVFVGRREQFDLLMKMYGRSVEGHLSCALVHGSPGIGKSALVDHFLRQLDRQEEVVVLRGRCYEREWLPYRALDSIVDELAERLIAGQAAGAGTLPLPDIGPLVQLFPALGRVPWISRQLAPPQEGGATQDVRQKAVEALRELLRQLAAKGHVVLVVDDLQWEDGDGAILLGDLVSPPDPPPLLLVACYRSEDVHRNDCLGGFLARLERLVTSESRGDVAVGPLKLDEAQQLAERLLSRTLAGSAVTAEVVRESGGNPYLLSELVRHVEHAPGWMECQVDLETVLSQRVESLPGPARQLLTLLAVAGHPLRMLDACRATRVKPEPRTLVLLVSEHLVRISGNGGEGSLDTYHDRVREILVGRLSAEDQSEHHRQLALTLEDTPDADPQLLFTHFDAANDRRKAGLYVLPAAERAVTNLAFDQAARLYQRAFALEAVASDQTHEVRVRLADALANAGRSVESAGEYQTAAAGFSGTAALELQRRAAELLLRAGRLEEGCRILSTTLSAVGLRMPRSAFQAKLMALVNHFRLRLRGTRYRERFEHEIPAEELARLDTCWSATVLMITGGFRALPFATGFPLLALQVGEPYRVSLALAQLGVLRSYEGDWEGAMEVFGRAESLARRLGRPQALGYARMALGFAHVMRGAWRAALGCSVEAEAIFREQSDAIQLERSSTQPAILAALFFLGEVPEIARRVPQMIADAHRCEDALSAAVPYTYFGNVAWLAADDAEQARRHAHEVLARLPATPFLQQHLLELVGSMQIDLYLGDGRRAGQRITDAWPKYRQSIYRGVPLYRAVLHHLRARAALAAIDMGENDARLIRSAVYDAKKLEHERMAWCDPLAGLIRAGVAVVSGRGEAAAEMLKRAISQADAADMPLFAAAGRRRLGQLRHDQEGRSLIRDADAWMESRGIRVPWRFAAMLVPGFGGR